MTSVLRLASLFGRASRREFTIVALVTVFLSVVHTLLIVSQPEVFRLAGPNAASGGVTILLTYAQVAVAVRRMHDLGKTGWLLLVWIVPMAGVVLLIWLFRRPGTEGRNRYGPQPDPRRP